MWLVMCIGILMALIGVIGLYVAEYQDDFNHKGKHRKHGGIQWTILTGTKSLL